MIKKDIKFLVLDVDGTLTDGKVYIGADGEMMKAFNIKDGYGINDRLRSVEIIPIIITGRESTILVNRCKELGIENIHQGIHDKMQKLDEILERFSCANNRIYGYENCAYCGDDLNDFKCMQVIKKSGGIVGCPSDAVKEVRDISDFVSNYNGGDGAVREFIEWLLK